MQSVTANARESCSPALDIRHKLELLSILHRMSREQGITVVMSLHEIDLAMKISDRIICVRGEEIFACGKPSEILDDETVRKLYDLDPALGRFDAKNGSLDLFFAEKESCVNADRPMKEDTAEEAVIAESKKVSSKADEKETESIAIPRLMIAAPGSGSGKTLVTCGLLRLLQRKNLHPAAFKCGPDYIDPMFLGRIISTPCSTGRYWAFPPATWTPSSPPRTRKMPQIPQRRLWHARRPKTGRA